MCRDCRYTLVRVMAWLTFLAWVSACEGAETALLFSFEKGVEGWRPRVDSLTVTHVEAPGAVAGSEGQLQIKGQIAADWNYAMSKHLAIEPAGSIG